MGVSCHWQKMMVRVGVGSWWTMSANKADHSIVIIICSYLPQTHHNSLRRPIWPSNVDNIIKSKFCGQNCTFACANHAFMVKISIFIVCLHLQTAFSWSNCYFAWANLSSIHKCVFMGHLCICICKHAIHGPTKHLHLHIFPCPWPKGMLSYWKVFSCALI